MAQPSSTHHERTERDRDRDRERHHRSDRERSSHHHHRTISSTTLLLVLSLVLAGLAVMLSLPRQYSADSTTEGGSSSGVFGMLSPKRTQALIARESAVAVREAEVARREAELLIGAPGGVLPTPTPVLCPPCAATTYVETVTPPIQTIIKEIVKEDSLTPPGWNNGRAEDVLERELRVSERERDITKREESVNRREHDASRREGWIMEQLIALGNDHPEVEEEYVYEPKRKVKALPFETETKTVVQTQTVTVPAPANTRRASPPTPQVADSSFKTDSPRTTAIEFITEDDLKTVVVRSPKPTRRPPRGWFGGW
ncbi:Phenylalanyl-tRNA synthetase [Mycena indigotica]|uniref:Phenylalanyl-tRNA synthetase n=1 Tax=Mycena indigotica TaxID=2126181 RepID=A0A8H6W0J0_9AGAR|nr:Phenylalanyl-tRNA synthetase [Mycena indigotica]KAF7294924.1 Phenylalanyl-tRNA synthetase [Mycena indigotica]